MAIRIIHRWTIRIALFVALVSFMPILVPPVGRLQFLVRDNSQVIFDPAHVPLVEAPVIVAEFVEIRKRVSLNSPTHVYVRVEVTPDQLPQVTKHRFASMQAHVARTRNRSPEPIFLKNEDDVVQQVPRFDIQKERGITMLLEN